MSRMFKMELKMYNFSNSKRELRDVRPLPPLGLLDSNPYHHQHQEAAAAATTAAAAAATATEHEPGCKMSNSTSLQGKQQESNKMAQVIEGERIIMASSIIPAKNGPSLLF